MPFTPLSPDTPQPSPAALPLTTPFTVPLAQAFHRLFNDEERVIVLTLNEAGHLTHYEVKPLADVIILLDLSGFGQPLPNAFP